MSIDDGFKQRVAALEQAWRAERRDLDAEMAALCEALQQLQAHIEANGRALAALRDREDGTNGTGGR